MGKDASTLPATKTPTKKRKPRKARKTKAITTKGNKIRRGLSARQLKFISLYMANGFNSIAAARDAGYASEYRASAWQILHRPAVTAEINRCLDAQGLTPEKIKIGIAEIAFGGDIADAEEFLRGKKDLADLREDGDLNTRTVKSVTIRRTAGERTVSESRKVEMYDRLSALEKLAKVRGLLTDSTPTPAPVTIRIDVLSALTRMLDRMEASLPKGGDCVTVPLGLPMMDAEAVDGKEKKP